MREGFHHIEGVNFGNAMQTVHVDQWNSDLPPHMRLNVYQLLSCYQDEPLTRTPNGYIFANALDATIFASVDFGQARYYFPQTEEGLKAAIMFLWMNG